MISHDWKTWTYNQMVIDKRIYKEEATYCETCKMEMPFDISWPEYLEIWKSPCPGVPVTPEAA